MGDHAFIVKPHWFFQNKHDVFIGEALSVISFVSGFGMREIMV